MSNRRRRGCRLLAVVLWLVAVQSLAWAQSPGGLEATGDGPRVQELKIQVLPEFDDPRTLIVVQGRLAAASETFPQAVVFRLPAAAQINQMAVMDLMAGGVVAQEYEVEIDPEAPEWVLVRYALENPHFFYEYYVGTPQDRGERSVAITWQSLQPIDHLVLEIAEPLGAVAFTLEPVSTASRVDGALGLTFHQIEVRDVAADEPVSIAFRYERESEAPSFTHQTASPGATIVGNPDVVQATMAPVPESAGDRFWLWLLMPVGAVVVLAGALIAQRRLQWSGADPRPTVGGAAVFCRVCGTHLREGAQFCHRCGAGADGPLGE